MPTRSKAFSVHTYGILICVIAGFFYAYEFLLRIIPGAMQTELMAALGHLSASTFGQIAALYYWAYSPMQLPVGILMDRYGPRCILTIACLLCALGMLLFTASSALFWIGAGRFLVGLGSSFGFVGMLFLGHHWLPNKYFSLLVGLATSFAMLVLIFGVVKITDIVAEVSVFSILSVLTGFGFILTFFIYGVVRDAPQGVKALHSQPWIPFFEAVLTVLKTPSVWLVGWIGASMYTSLSVFGELWGKTYLEQAHQLTSMQAAKAISMVFLGWAIGAPFSGYFSDRFQSRILPLLVSTLCSFLCISVILYGYHLSFLTLSLLLLGYGLFTSSEIIIFILAKELSEARLAGTVFAIVNMIVMLGGAILQPLVGYLLDWHAAFHHETALNYVYTVADYRFALTVLPLSLVMVVVLLGAFYKVYGRR